MIFFDYQIVILTIILLTLHRLKEILSFQSKEHRISLPKALKIYVIFFTGRCVFYFISKSQNQNNKDFLSLKIVFRKI